MSVSLQQESPRRYFRNISIGAHKIMEEGHCLVVGMLIEDAGQTCSAPLPVSRSMNAYFCGCSSELYIILEEGILNLF